MTGTTALALYSQDWLTDDAFMSGFVAHEDLAAHFLDRLRRLGPKAMAQHQIIVGEPILTIEDERSEAARYEAERFRAPERIARAWRLERRKQRVFFC